MVRIAIGLPDGLLETIEHECSTRNVSRSEFLWLAVERLLRSEEGAELERRYAEGYIKDPETREELGWLRQASEGVLTEYPWDGERPPQKGPKP